MALNRGDAHEAVTKSGQVWVRTSLRARMRNAQEIVKTALAMSGDLDSLHPQAIVAFDRYEWFTDDHPCAIAGDFAQAAPGIGIQPVGILQ